MDCSLCEEFCDDICNACLNIDDQYVWTDFYRTIPKVDHLQSVEDPDQNFTPYMMFSLKSYLNNWINFHWNPQIDLTFP